MNGAEAVLRTAAAAGVEVCFANPGTTEMALVSALDDVPIRAVLGLFEGVCSGAADGCARMSGRPAMTLLHLGPGFANAIANLHNARRARSPVVNLVGDHATWHRAADAPLSSDIVSLARPVSRWVRESRSAAGVAQDAAEAIAAAQEAPGGVATLIIPSDCQAGDSPGPARAIAAAPARRVSADTVERIAAQMRGRDNAALFLGAKALSARGQMAAARVARATGSRLISETFPARFERGGTLPAVDRLPYFPEWVMSFLEGVRTLVLAGATEPVAFFGYPGTPSRLTPGGCAIATLAAPEEDVEAALESLADALDARAASPAPSPQKPEMPQGPLDPQAVGVVLSLLQPEGAIIVDESNTSGLGYFQAAAAAPPHTLLTLTGGSIGMGPACATGAATACPDRTVINFQGDGGAMYTVQSLWTQAREQLHVITLVCANGTYRILQIESSRAGVSAPRPKALSLTELDRPRLDWVQIAQGMGVPASRADSAEALRRALSRAIVEPGPHLVEVVL
ncbi:MAG: acetolactate synthase large subunit [Myxococcales bacterium]